MKLDKSILGVAGELAVASELCRRNIYAQLTFGNQKRTDLLVIGLKGICKIEVKCKQSYQWPQWINRDSDYFSKMVSYTKSNKQSLSLFIQNPLIPPCPPDYKAGIPKSYPPSVFLFSNRIFN